MPRLLYRLGFRPVAAPPARVAPGLALALARGDGDRLAMYSAAHALLLVLATARHTAMEGHDVRADD